MKLGGKNLLRQRGVAVVTALLLTTLSITIVASLFWQQQVQVRSIENQRLQLQKQWILRGALDWASLILRADGALTSVDHLGEPWAVPLADTRLDQYVENGKADGDAADATLSGSIIDAQSRYNLVNLAPEGKVNPEELLVFRNLLSALRMNPSLAQPAAEAVAAGQPKVQEQNSQTGARSMENKPRPMKFEFVDDLLSVPGFTPAIVQQLRDHVVVLPAPTKINANTASVEVLAATLGGLANFSEVDAATLVAARDSAHLRDGADIGLRLGRTDAEAKKELEKELQTKSNYFFVNGKVRMNRAGLEIQALLNRGEPGAGGAAMPTVVWIREN